MMLVGFKPKWAKRVIEVEVRLAAEKQKVPSSVVHFTHLDSFLKEWFLIG